MANRYQLISLILQYIDKLGEIDDDKIKEIKTILRLELYK